MNELKPCPFCGYTKSRVMEKKIRGSWIKALSNFVQVRYYVMCNKCHAKGGSVVSDRMAYDEVSIYTPVKFSKETTDMYKQQAIEAWNERIANESSVEIVRCEDCDYWTFDENSYQSMYGLCKLHNRTRTCSFFCASGKRRIDR